MKMVVLLGKLNAQGAIVCDGWYELVVPYLESYKGQRAVARYYVVASGSYDGSRSRSVDLENRRVE